MSRLAANIRPSLKSGYARNASESAFPGLWDGMDFASVPCLGITGEQLHDFSGKGNDIAFTQSATSAIWRTLNEYTDATPGSGQLKYLGPGLQLSNDTHEVTIASHAEGTSGRSVFSFFRQGSLSDTTGHWLVNKRGNTSSTGQHWQMILRYVDGSWYMRANAWDSADGQYTITDTEALANPRYYTSAFTVGGEAGATLRGYKNGVEYGSTTLGANPPKQGTEQIVIGKASWTSSYRLRGDVYTVLGWQRVLSPQEIALLHADPLAPFRKRSTVVTSFADGAVEPVAYPIIRTQQTQPSFKSGYARNAAESAFPELWTGLEGAWIPGLGQTGDVLYDVSGNKRNALPNSYSLSANWSSPVADPPISNTFSVPQATETRYRLDIEDTPFPGGNTRWDSITLIAWYKPNTGVETNKSGIIIGAGDNSNNTTSGVRLLQSRPSGTNQLGIKANNNSGDGAAHVNVSNFGEWYYLAGTADVNENLARFTIVRHSVGIDSLTTATDTMNGLIEQDGYVWRIGGQPGADDNPDGSYGPCMVYGRKLSDEEILLLYTDPLAPFRKRSTVVTSFAPSVEPVAYPIIRTRTPRQTQPSLKSGYARNASESAFPDLWRELNIAHVPELGLTGNLLPDYSGNHDLNFNGTGSVADQNFYRGSYCHLWNTDGEGVVLDSHPARGNSGMTAMVFYSPLDLTTGGAKWVFSKMTADEVNIQWMLNHTSNNEKVRFYISTLSSTRNIESTVNTVSGGDWQHVAATLGTDDGSFYGDAALYLNGENVGTQSSWPVGYDEAGKIWIGQRFSSNLSAESYIKSAYYWNRVLTQEEVRMFTADPLVLFRKRSSFILSSADPAVASAYRIYENYYRQLMASGPRF